MYTEILSQCMLYLLIVSQMFPLTSIGKSMIAHGTPSLINSQHYEVFQPVMLVFPNVANFLTAVDQTKGHGF